MTSYKDAGVDVNAGYEAVRLMKGHIRKTFRPEVLTDIGGFGGLFALNAQNFKNPILVSGTDGVGTKLKIAFIMNRHDTVGIDCVAMCVNDIICSGAQPLFFLDYLALGKNKPEKVADIVKGVSEGCIMSGCSLIGGETAEMPGFYPEDEYDMAGFAVGVVERDRIIDGKKVVEGDRLIGLASSGLHSNGYSLVRKVLNPDKEKLSQPVRHIGSTLGEELLKPTKIYVKTILELIDKFVIKSIMNITGGGFYENIPRGIPEGLRAKVNLGSWPVPPIFKLLEQTGGISPNDMFNTFNMGIGMVLIVSSSVEKDMLDYLNRQGETAYSIGEITKGDAGVEIC